ncbi:zona pellucida sperm-binding protein 3-like [Acanthochromis polyacanthus]|uniref:zona pellucida sperm-binding protein 3-like n=1 Tax=Acanthochromis polyacanthus TaxID=80966 RepID=UPI00223426F2|nr:zona pellucida sperm-binding protein 3-like [Acanthochromis polyacanthus]
MGFGGAVLLGLALLFSGGIVCCAAQNSLNFSTNETRVPQEQMVTSLQLPTSPQTTRHQSNQTEPKDPVDSAVSYRLRSFWLRKQKPVEEDVEQKFQVTSEQQVEAPETERVQIQGPDLKQTVKKEPKVLVRFEQRVPVPADSVRVRCGEEKVTIEVKQNFLGNSQFIRPSDLTLGGCAAVNATDHVLQFQTELQGCGSTMTMTDEALIYSFSLTYSPTPIRDTFILKTNPAEVQIRCHYQRRHYVSSSAMMPTWKPFAFDMQADQQLHFSLRLMTEDWQSPRPSSVYFLSDVMHIEASVLQGHHVPLRVYVDGCVATATPDPHSQPRYSFINNHGCLTDAKLTGAKSYFMQRSQEDKLHFQLKAFRFHQDDRNPLYITCHLKATTVSVPVDLQHKACSYLTEARRWVASGGDNKVCRCCETSCSQRRRKRSLAADAALRWEGTAALGPITLEDDGVLQSEPTPQPHEMTRCAASGSSIALLSGVGASIAGMLLVLMGAVICSRRWKPTEYPVST